MNKKEPVQYWFPYWGPLLIESTVDDEFVRLLLEKGNECRKRKLDATNNLAGMIDNEFYYPLNEVEEWFIPKFNPYVNAYMEAIHHTWIMSHEEPMKKWFISRLWINYQKANEYNPPHDHGGDLSFVLYLQVPDEIKEEFKRDQGKRNNTGPGTINFTYGEKLPFNINRIYKMPSAKDLYIFPAWLSHYVHHFTSDVERISVSGNVGIEYHSDFDGMHHKFLGPFDK